MSHNTILHLRTETKPFEHRSALTPATTKALIDDGYTVYVERSPPRIFDDEEFEKVGAILVPEHSWKEAPKDRIIIGLKELEVEDFPLVHEHVQFAHCYKNQFGWEDVLARFPAGNGTLYDLEFLQDETGRRVAAFGFYAGFAGAALGAWDWATRQLTGKPLGQVEPFQNEAELIKTIKADIAKVPGGKVPSAMVIGALGRCGKGAVDCFQKLGVADSDILKWDINETKKGGPFKEALDVDIFVNCIYLTQKIAPFLTVDQINEASDRKLKVIVDVSADFTNPNNPVPVVDRDSTFKDPVYTANGITGQPIDVVAIDHLPTLLPREASEAFSADLLPSLKELKNRDSARVWTDAKKLFDDFVEKLN